THDGTLMTKLGFSRPAPDAAWRPGLRALVLSISGALVIATAVVVSVTVSDHLRSAAVAEAVVRGYVDGSLTHEAMADPAGPAAAVINGELSRLVAAGKILRIKVWAT